jgi:hypothetical protein
MRKSFFLILALLFTSASIFSQKGARREELQEKIKSMKIGFITNKINLTPQESEKFWPIYNQMEEERQALLSDKRSDFSKQDEEKDPQSYITRHFEFKEKEIALEKKYVEKFKAAIPLKKIAKLLFVEKQFRQEVMSNVVKKARQKRE